MSSEIFVSSIITKDESLSKELTRPQVYQCSPPDLYYQIEKIWLGRQLWYEYTLTVVECNED